MQHPFGNYIIFYCFSSANKCLLKVGAYSAQLEQYAKAIEIYEQVPERTHACTHTRTHTFEYTHAQINAFQMSQRGVEPFSLTGSWPESKQAVVH